MDYDDNFPSAPVRYAFDDSDDELDVATTSAVPPSNPLSVGLVEPFPAKPCTLVLGVNAGASYINALDTAVNGHITYEDENSKKKKPDADISITEDMTFVSFPHIEADDAHWYSEIVFSLPGLQIERVVLLDSYVSTDYTNRQWADGAKPPFLRLLQTSSTATKIPNTEPYEAPNLVKDLSAALLAHCEIHSIPCYALFSLQESLLGKHIITNDTCTAYSQGLDKLSIRLPLDKAKLEQVLEKGRVNEHHHRLYL